MRVGVPRQRWKAIGLLALVSLNFGECSSSPAAPSPSPPVVDPPSISCPVSQSITSFLATPIPVVYGSPTVAGGSSPVTTTCTPESGATFPIGSTAVRCTATDGKQRTSTCSLTVTVVARVPLALTRFAAFGDSITWGEDGTNPPTLDAGPFFPVQLVGSEYPMLLRTALQARYPLQLSSISLANLGSRGESAGDPLALTRFSRDVLSGGYQSVLLMEGSNDTNDAVRSGVQVQQAAIANLRTMLRTARGANLRPYLATIPPMNNSPSACNPACRGTGRDLVPAFNDSIRSLAQSEGVTVVDVYNAFGGDLSLLSTDGLHPNALGYQRIADTFFNKLVETLEQNPPGAAFGR